MRVLFLAFVLLLIPACVSTQGRNSSADDRVDYWSEEDEQAMEQWLRRIPDDPGGLLRRKFRNEHQRRGAPADESEDW